MQLEAGTYIGTREAAAILGVSPALLRLWRSEGRGPESIKLGGTVVYGEETVKAYAKRRHD